MLPDEIKCETVSERGKAPMIILKSHDKQLLGQVCAKIRAMKSLSHTKARESSLKENTLEEKVGSSNLIGYHSIRLKKKQDQKAYSRYCIWYGRKTSYVCLSFKQGHLCSIDR